MKKFIITFTTLYALSLVGCFNPKEKGIKGQAYVSFGENYSGQAMVDFPIFCYGPEFEKNIQSLKAVISADYVKFDKINAELRASWNEAENAYLTDLKVYFKESLEEYNFKIIQDQQQSKIDTALKEIQELEAQQRATTELAELLSPFIAEQRQLVEEGYANIETEIARTNDLIGKINNVIVEKSLLLYPYDKIDLNFKKAYPNIKNCWDRSHNFYLNYEILAVTEKDRVNFYEYDKFSSRVGRYNVLFSAENSNSLLYSSLPRELTPYLNEEISRAFYKHIKLAKIRLSAIRDEVNKSVKEADDALLLYANKNGIRKGQVKSIIKNSMVLADYEPKISERISSLDALLNTDIAAEGLKFIEAIDDAVDVDALDEVVRRLDVYNIPFSDYIEFLESEGFVQPDEPDYTDRSGTYQIMISQLFDKPNLIVRTDLSGEFLIPEGMAYYYAMVKEDNDEYYWSAPVTETTDKVLITNSTAITDNPINLLFSDGELEELLIAE